MVRVRIPAAKVVSKKAPNASTKLSAKTMKDPRPASPDSVASSVPSPSSAALEGPGDNSASNGMLLFEDLPPEPNVGDSGASPLPQQRRQRATTPGAQLIICPVCDRSFKNRSGLLNHEGIHENPRPFLCADCPKGYPTEYLLMRHERKHFRGRPYRCPDCPRKFLWKAFLKRHVRDLHSGVKAYSCDICGESFHFSINAYMHKKKEHAEHVRRSTRQQKK